MILSIETSCDDTSIALTSLDGVLIDFQTVTKDSDHAVFGGILPERASRNHLEVFFPILENLLSNNNISLEAISHIAATSRPGLMGSLIVGCTIGESLSKFLKIPFVPLNHIEGHLVSPFISSSDAITGKQVFPQLGLVVSGGHTHLFFKKEMGEMFFLLGKTYDDAAGEAFDKFGKILGLGFPGGVRVDQQAQNGDPKKYKFPIGLEKENSLNFSFSGVKSSASRLIEKMGDSLNSEEISDLCASYQYSIVRALEIRLRSAVERYCPSQLTISGGVSANSSLRKLAEKLEDEYTLSVVVPELKYCGDNAAMMGLLAALKLSSKENRSGLTEEVKLSACSLTKDFPFYDEI